MSDQKVFDPLLWLVILSFGGMAATGLLYVLYLFVSVIFLGESSTCPQNSCPQ
jgi:hypothetical protein